MCIDLSAYCVYLYAIYCKNLLQKHCTKCVTQCVILASIWLLVFSSVLLDVEMFSY